MHVPKTSGVSLAEALREGLQPKTVFRGFDRVLFGDFEDFTSLGPSIADQVYLSPQDIPAADLVVGHFAYSSLRARYPGGQFVSILREPCSRLLSHWLYWRGHTDEQLAPWGKWGDRVKHSRRPLLEFLREPAIAFHVDNLALRMLLWPHRLIPTNGFIDPAHHEALLDEARARLSQFHFLGVVENPSLVADLARWLRRPITKLRLNETNKVPAYLREPLAQALTPDALDLLDRCTALDLALWNDVARQSLRAEEAASLRHGAMLRNVARYAEMMAA